MFTPKQLSTISSILDNSQTILIIQADNPDADSLGSALALEDFIQQLGKETILYCGVDMPAYLRYMQGWDRVTSDFPNKFDCSIIVDASTLVLLEKITNIGAKGWIASKPCIVLDHHKEVDHVIDFAKISINEPAFSSTCELLYWLARSLKWEVNTTNCEYLMAGILGDTQNLTNDLATVQTYKTMTEMIELGVNRSELEEARRQFNKMPDSIYYYKSELIKRTELHSNGQIALVTVPQNELNDFSPLYNPVALIQGDMQQIDTVKIAIVFKVYDSGKITAALRSNNDFPVAGNVAAHFGGGGHANASGFKILEGKSIEQLKKEVLDYIETLLDKHNA